MMKCRCFFMIALAMFTFTVSISAGEPATELSGIFLNGKPAELTIQDLSGFGTRPLRLLVNRNNNAYGEGFIRVYALGVREGDEFSALLSPRVSGVRATVYRIFRQQNDGPRYLSMPASTYFDVPKTETYREKIESYGEEFLIFVFEKTDAPDEKNIQVRYFEERVRKLVIASFKTNLMFSSLKLKMKDFGGEETAGFFERDAQLLVDRMSRPQEVVLLRLWKKTS